MSDAPNAIPSGTSKSMVSLGRCVPAATWLLFCTSACLEIHSQAQSPWVPPAAFPEERYQNGWSKNPFTLKTAPVALQRESFAKNLALGSMYDDAEGLTSVVVVNTKTRERVRLRGQEAAPNGMRVQESVIADTRRDSYAVVVMGGEKATLRYDEAFLKQMAAGGGGAAPNGGVAAAQKKGANGGAEGMTQPSPEGMDGSAAPAGSAPTVAAGGGSPVPPPPGVRPPGPTGQGGRPTIMSRRRLTAPGAMPQPPPPPLAPTDNP